MQDWAEEWEGWEGRVEVDVDHDVSARGGVEAELRGGFGVWQKYISMSKTCSKEPSNRDYNAHQLWGSSLLE